MRSEAAGRAAAVPTAFVVLVGLFVTALVTAQLISAKVLALGVPVLGPLLSPAGVLIAPAGTLAYAVTYFASDCIAELYGKRNAQRVVNVGFAMNFVMLGLVWLAIALPAAQGSVDPGMFATVMSSGTPIVLGSLLAYVVSQNWDVLVFHRLREVTDGEALWLRNVGSTASSQLLDTLIFTVVAFAVAPALLGLGQTLSTAVIAQIIVGQYVLKVLIAVFDTPFVYAVVGLLRAAAADGAAAGAGTTGE